MKKALILFIYISFSYLLKAQSLELDWVKQIGGTSDDAGMSVAVDISGNVYTSGNYYGTTDFDPGPGTFTLALPVGFSSVYICKLDANGNFIWAKNIVQASNSPDVFDLEIDKSDNIYVTGSYFNTGDFDPGSGVFTLNSNGLRDIYISKLDQQGNLIWAKNMGGREHDGGRSMSIDVKGNIYATGTFKDTVDFDPGIGVHNLIALPGTMNLDIFVSKLDSSGNFIWAKSMGSNNLDLVYSLALDAFNNVYTAGVFYDVADFDPGPGIYILPYDGHVDAFISKLDSSGNFVWAKKIEGKEYNEIYSLTIDNNNNLYAAGTFDSIADFDTGSGIFNMTSYGNTDAFALKLDGSGNFVWAKQIGGTSRDAGGYIITDAYGNNYTMGTFGGIIDFDPGPSVANLSSFGNGDAFILKLDSAGNFIWVSTFGGITDDVPNAIALDSAGCLYTTGWFNGTSDFDPGAGAVNLTSFGLADAFVHKMHASTVSIKKNSINNNILVYPNPNNGLFYIKLNETAKVIITNAIGQEITTNFLETGKHNFDIQNQSSGIYFVKVIQEGRQYVIKLIKE